MPDGGVCQSPTVSGGVGDDADPGYPEGIDMGARPHGSRLRRLRCLAQQDADHGVGARPHVAGGVSAGAVGQAPAEGGQASGPVTAPSKPGDSDSMPVRRLSSAHGAGMELSRE